ncbi:carbohydrate kinase family protein [Candidatus Peregrinibacteria bacterium]|nr:MAG: carbohydrate kinase family protein [Candidatus Peregrinibacteria bacterium]
MKARILAVGSLTSDLFLRPRRQEIFHKEGHEFIGLCLGDKVRIEERHDTYGGGGCNVAVGLARFGVPTDMLGMTGDGLASERIFRNLRNEGVGVQHIQQEKGGKSGFSVVLSSESGERTVLFSPGANDHFCDFDESIMEDYEGVCLQHLSGCSVNVFGKIRNYFVKHPQKFLSWNPGRESLEQGCEAYADFIPVVDVLLINREEAQLFTGKKELKEMFRTFYKFQFQGNVIITDGMRGATGCNGKETYTCPVYEGLDRKDTLGAGDSFMTGVVGGLLLGEDLPSSLKLATINAAHVVSCYGSQTCLQSYENLRKLTDKIHIETKTFPLSA